MVLSGAKSDPLIQRLPVSPHFNSVLEVLCSIGEIEWGMRQCRIWLTSHCFTGVLSIRHQINSHSRAMLLSAMEWLLCLCRRPSCLFLALTLSGFKECLYINSFAKCSKETKHTLEYIVTAILSYTRSKQLECLLKTNSALRQELHFVCKMKRKQSILIFDAILYLLAYCRQAVSLFGN